MVNKALRIGLCVIGFILSVFLLALGFNFIFTLIVEGLESSIYVLIGLLFIIAGLVISFFSGYYLQGKS